MTREERMVERYLWVAIEMSDIWINRDREDPHVALSAALEGLWGASRTWKGSEHSPEFVTYSRTAMTNRRNMVFRRDNAKKRGRQFNHVPIDFEVEDGTNLGDLLLDENVLSPAESACNLELVAERRQLAEGILEEAPPRARRLLRLYYGFTGPGNMTMAQVGQRLGMKTSNVKTIIHRAIVRSKKNRGLK